MHQFGPAYPLDLVVSELPEHLTFELAVPIVEEAVILVAGCLESKHKLKFSIYM